jgi:integrase
MIKTKSGLPKYCCRNRDQRGNSYIRFRKSGATINLPGVPWSTSFMAAYASALEGATPSGNIGAARTQPGTINALILSYYRSPEFRDLKASSQKVRRNVIEKFRNERGPSGQIYGDKPLRGLERRHIRDIHGAKADTPESANSLLKALRILFAHAVEHELIAHNPAIGIKRYRSKGDGFHCWFEPEIEAFKQTYPIGSRERLIFSLCLFTGQRISDVATMGWQNVKKDKGRDWIAVRQIKTAAPLLIPMHPELVEVLAAVPKTNMAFLVDAAGAPFTAAWMSQWFSAQCDAAGLPQCTAHGLRKAAARRLAEAGCTEKQIAAVLGHASLKEVARYTKHANQALLAEQALELQLRAEQPRTKIVQRKTRLDKAGG